MRIFRVVAVTVSIMFLILSCITIGCSENGNPADGDGNDDGNGDGTSTASGEILGVFIYTTNYVPDPVTGQPSAQYTLTDVTPAIEDEDGNIFILAAVGRETHFEYDGMSPSEATINIAGYTYTVVLSSYEWRDVGEQKRKVSYTGIQVAVTGTIYTETEGYLSGEWIDVETIEELP